MSLKICFSQLLFLILHANTRIMCRFSEPNRKSRPIASDREALERLYVERRELYEKYSDIRIDNNEALSKAAEAIEKIMEESL